MAVFYERVAAIPLPSPTTVLWATSTKSVEMHVCPFVFVVGEGVVGVGAQACAVAALVCLQLRASVLCRQKRQKKKPFP
jgi:hypothetical protein